MVEFFGIPRQRAGRAAINVEGATAAEALAAVERACPHLAGLLRANGKLSPHYLLSIGGQRFVHDLGEALRPGERLLLLSADAGG
jgi:hypothetical protein